MKKSINPGGEALAQGDKAYKTPGNRAESEGRMDRILWYRKSFGIVDVKNLKIVVKKLNKIVRNRMTVLTLSVMIQNL